MIELTGHTGLVLALAYSPDGGTLASASDDGTARLWDVRTGRLLEKLQSPAARAYCVAFAPDGQSLAVGYGVGAGMAQWWELNPVRRRESWAAHREITRAVAFSRNGKYLITGGSLPTLAVWRLEDLEWWPAPTDDPAAATAIAVHPTRDLFAALSITPARVGLWSFTPPRCRRLQDLEIASPMTPWGHALAFSPDGSAIAAGLGREVAVWRWEAKSATPARWVAHEQSVYGLAYTPDGGTLLTGGADGLVKMWGLDGQLRHTFDWRIGDVAAVAFAPDGLTAAAGGFETILVWDVEGG